jgi:hypothetical protein
MKNDINLLYKRKTKKYSSKNITFLLLIIVLIGAVVYAGIALPSGELQALKKEAAEVKNKLSASFVDKQDLANKTGRQNELNSQLAVLTALKESKTDILNYIDVIERSCPSNVIVTQMATSSNYINLLGKADSDRTIALFCLRLREQNMFKSVFLSSSLTSPEYNITSFVITVTLPSPLEGKAIILELEQKDDLT